MKHIWTKNEIDYLIDNFNLKTKEELCSELNRTWSSIKNQLFKLKLHRNIGLLNLRKSKIEILLEETNETYYWLGFLAADGHFYNSGRIKLDISTVDKSMYKIKMFVKN